PNTAEIVHEVLQSAEQPLTFEDSCTRVNPRRPVTTVNTAAGRGPTPCRQLTGHSPFVTRTDEFLKRSRFSTVVEPDAVHLSTAQLLGAELAPAADTATVS